MIIEQTPFLWQSNGFINRMYFRGCSFLRHEEGSLWKCVCFVDWRGKIMFYISSPWAEQGVEIRRAHDKVVCGALRGLGTEWKETHYINGWCQWTACQPPQSQNSICNICTLMHHPSKASWTIANLPLRLQYIGCFYGCNLGSSPKQVYEMNTWKHSQKS